MIKNIYCKNKINSYQTVMETAYSNCREFEKSIISKRVNIVSIKMVKEGSILYSKRRIYSSSDAVNIAREFLDTCDREQLIVICLNTKNEPTAIHTVSIGSLNSSIVHPREVFKPAILSNSASIIISHNHPSGCPDPSLEDINITKRIKEAGEILGIKLLDHIIIGDNNNYISIKEKELI